MELKGRDQVEEKEILVFILTELTYSISFMYKGQLFLLIKVFKILWIKKNNISVINA